jgi:arylsulfatase A-like enzyme
MFRDHDERATPRTPVVAMDARQGMKRSLSLVILVFALCGVGLGQVRRPSIQVVMIVDGLRPDYVTAELMPRLTRLGQRGVVFQAHHAVFPTVTRVNSASITTGTYPETHGLMGNSIYIPAADPARSLDTAVRENLEAVANAEGRLLTAPALGEILQRSGKTLLVASAGSSGSAFLLNPVAGIGTTINTEFIRPTELSARVAGILGNPPAEATPNAARNRYAVEAYVRFGVEDLRPDVTFIWFGDPDHTGHEHGIGSDLTRKALALVDAEIGRIEDTLRTRGLLDRTNLVVTSDHGFSTQTGELRLGALLEPLARPMADGSPDIVNAGGSIHIRGGADAARLNAIVSVLRQRPEVGAIFTRPGPNGGPEGIVPGTLSFDVARWNHARSGDILVSANWSHAANKAGYKGTTTQTGVAGHGTSSVYDIHNTLIAAGPDFRERTVSSVPTANVDLAPTLLHLLGLPQAPSMTGRVIFEVLRNGGPSAPPRVDRRIETVRTPDGSYELSAHISVVGPYRYLDYTEVKRASR